MIDYFIQKSYPELPTWKLLIGMLTSSREQDIRASVYCLLLMTNTNRRHWRSILDTNGIDRLCDLLKKYALTLNAPAVVPAGKQQTASGDDDDDQDEGDENMSEKQAEMKRKADAESLTLNTISVLCNLADQTEVKERLSSTDGLFGVLSKILSLSPNEDIQSRVSILIGDVASVVSDNQSALAKHGCLSKLLELLTHNVEDLLINTVNAIEIMCLNNAENQNFCADNAVFLSFMDILRLNSG